MVWNPCTGQTRWIPPIDRCESYALGSYQDNKSGDNSYKILCFNSWATKYQIYEINSCLWRTLDVNTLDFFLEFNEWGMHLKRKTYWFASNEKEEQLGIFLVSFDYTTEIFERLLLPCQYPSYETASLSVVREEKLAVLLQHKNTTRTEIWVTNKIDETKLIVSWSKVLTVDLEPELGTWRDVSFFFDEEKKFLVCCDINVSDRDNHKHMVYIVGEDNEVRRLNFGKPTSDPILLNYVPSLTRIQQSGSKRKKRKRIHM
ncbi:putative F-box protein [Cardamine amara subsp. amara]|uniref:F-box protein n=1 Tax=Cardamine amara subsp. amara TaxID=228776 RepID=A0ABD1ABH5_CARAN